jgi:hypothetical protein
MRMCRVAPWRGTRISGVVSGRYPLRLAAVTGGAPPDGFRDGPFGVVEPPCGIGAQPPITLGPIVDIDGSAPPPGTG